MHPNLRPVRFAMAAALIPAALLLASCNTEPPKPSGNAPAPTGANNPGNMAGNGPATGTSGKGSAQTALFDAPRKADGEITIKIITNGVSPFWDPMIVGMKKAASELGCKADWAAPDHAQVGEQKQLLESTVAQNVDGIAISCIDSKALDPDIKSVLEKKIPLITFDSDAPDSGRLCYIGTNNYNAGKAAGEAALKLLPKGGDFIGFVGNLSAENARDRRRGFEDAVKGKGIVLRDVLEDNKDKGRARKNVEDSITKYGDKIQGFLGLYSYNGPAIAQAVTDQNLRDKYKIVCFDAEPVALQELEKGHIDATIVQKPYDFGYIATKLLFEINKKGWSPAKSDLKIPDDGLYDTGVQTITPQNVKQYRQDLEKLGVKSS